MKPEIIFEHPRLILTHYPNESCILETWNGFTDFNLFAELLSKVIGLMAEKKARNLILDTREHKGLSPDGQQHGVDVCTNYAKKHGQMKHAIIVPNDVFSKFSVNNFTKKLEKSELVVNRYFSNLEDALSWMNEKID